MTRSDSDARACRDLELSVRPGARGRATGAGEGGRGAGEGQWRARARGPGDGRPPPDGARSPAHSGGSWAVAQRLEVVLPKEARCKIPRPCWRSPRARTSRRSRRSSRPPRASLRAASTSTSSVRAVLGEGGPPLCASDLSFQRALWGGEAGHGWGAGLARVEIEARARGRAETKPPGSRGWRRSEISGATVGGGVASAASAPRTGTSAATARARNRAALLLRRHGEGGARRGRSTPGVGGPPRASWGTRPAASAPRSSAHAHFSSPPACPSRRGRPRPAHAAHA